MSLLRQFSRAFGSVHYRRALTGVLLASTTACVVVPASSQPVAVSASITGVAAERANAMIAANRALSPENAIPTTFQSVVSLADPEVVAWAHAASAKAGHDGLYLDYYLFRAAVAKVQRTKADKLDIPNRTYRIYPAATQPDWQGVIDFSNLSHLVVDGHGSTLLFYYIGKASAPLTAVHPRAGIAINRSDHITLRDLTLDWDEQLAVPVTIGGTGQPGSPMTLTVNPSYPIDPGSPMPITVFKIFDFAKREFVHSRDMSPADYAAWLAPFKPGGAMPYVCAPPVSGISSSTCFRNTGGQTYVFGPNEHFRPFPAHPSSYLGTVRDNNFAAVAVEGASTYVNLSGVTVYSSPGQGFVVIGAGPGMHMNRCRVVRKPDASLHPGEPKRFISTLSDAMDVIGSAGDVVIENSEFGNEADDGLNINAGMRHSQAVGPHALQTSTDPTLNFYRVGGLVDVFDAKARNVIATGVPITGLTAPAAGQVTVTLGSGMAPLAAGTSYELRVHDYDSSRIVLRNNWFHDNSERGFVAHGGSVAILGNRFNGTAESAIQGVYDNQSGRSEGPPLDNLVIAGNTIRDVNVEWFDSGVRSVAAPAAIAIYFSARSGFTDSHPIEAGNVAARHIVISGNTIDYVPGAGILVSQAQDVIITDNHVTNVGQHVFGIPAIDGKAIVVEQAGGLRAARNVADAPMVFPGMSGW